MHSLQKQSAEYFVSYFLTASHWESSEGSSVFKLCRNVSYHRNTFWFLNSHMPGIPKRRIQIWLGPVM